MGLLRGLTDRPSTRRAALPRRCAASLFLLQHGPGGIALLRLAFGAAFLLHGWPKLQNPFGWMSGSDVPGVLQAPAAVAGFGGGIALILGLRPPVAALGTARTMLGALLLVHFPPGQPFVAPGGPSFEKPFVFLFVALLLVFTGPGGLSLDGLWISRNPAGRVTLRPGQLPR